MQNKTTKPEKTISLSNLPSIIIAVVLIVGIGTIYGLIGYLFSGIKENVAPTIQKPSLEIKDNYFGNEFIQIKLPQKNTVIENPVLISGKANVFEANVRVRILDDNKNILADDFITADGWMDKLYLFKKEIDYKMPQTENGLIEIFEESAKDGSDLHKIEIPVVFGENEDVFSDWEVYRNEEFGFEFEYPRNYSYKGEIENMMLNTKSLKTQETIRAISIQIRKNRTYESSNTIYGDLFNTSKMSFEEFIIGRIKIGCADSRAGGRDSREKYCIDETEIKPFLNAEGVTGYEIYITEVTEITTIKGMTTEKRKKGPIFVFDISEHNNDLGRGILFQLWDEAEQSLEKEVYSKVLDQIVSLFKFIEEDETANENKPSIYSSNGRESLLLLKGEKTGFPAYEFEKENIILFQEEIYDKEKSQNHYSLKTISTISPYEIKILIDNEHTSFMRNGRFLGEKNDVYFFEMEVDAPGWYYELFLFNPVNAAFVLIRNIYRYHNGPHSISLYGSASRVPFNFEKRSRISVTTGEILLPNDNDIEIIFNEKSFTKKEVDQGMADYIKNIFNYNLAPFAPIDIDETNGKKLNDSIDAYLKYFPEKIPYFTIERYRYEGTVEDFWANPEGYFDLEKNEFIPLSNL